MFFLLSILEEKIEWEGKESTGDPTYGVRENDGTQAVGDKGRDDKKIKLSHTDKASEHRNHRDHTFAKTTERASKNLV